MPVYNSSPTAYFLTAIYAGDSFNCINNEPSTSYPSGTAAAQVALGQTPGNAEADISAELTFSAAPGAFEIDVQTADTDINGAYQTVSNVGAITTASQTGGTGNYYVRAELHVKAKFARLYVKTQTANAVTITGKISR